MLVILNQKGGVGKTTLTANLGGLWARQGRRVLLVDNDPQASLTQGLMGPEATATLHVQRTIRAVYDGTLVDASQIVWPTRFPNLDLVPGSEKASAFNNGSPHLADPALQYCLKEVLQELVGSYTHMLIDCPPNLNLCSWVALTAGTSVLVPVQPEDYGAQGLPSVLRSISAVQQTTNPSLRFLGIVASMVSPRRALHQLYLEQLRESYGDKLFATLLAEAPEVAEATMQRMPVCHWKPKGASSKALAALAAEIERRSAEGVAA